MSMPVQPMFKKESGKYTDPRFRRRQVQLATFETLGRGLLVVWWRLEWWR